MINSGLIWGDLKQKDMPGFKRPIKTKPAFTGSIRDLMLPQELLFQYLLSLDIHQ